MTQQVTGIIGNTRSQQESATTSRTEQKQANWSLGFKIGIGATLLAIAVVLSTAELNLFSKLVTAVILIKLGDVLIEQKKKSDLLWVWPQILKYAGVATILIALLNSGIGAWTESIVKSVDTAASCSADPTQKVCVEKAEKEAADKAAIEKQRLAAMVRQQPVMEQAYVPEVPVGAPTRVENVPACSNDQWVKVDIPPSWNITMGWNEAAANYEWRKVKTGTWENSPEESSDAVRFCAKHQGYIGDTMTITWKKM